MNSTLLTIEMDGSLLQRHHMSTESFDNSTGSDDFGAGSTTTGFSADNVVYVVIGFVGIIGNLFACVVIVGYQPLRKRLANYFLLNQSILDLIIGISLLITSSVTSTGLRGAALYAACYIVNSRVLFTGFLTASTWNLAAMSVERYFKIVHPIQHKVRVVVISLAACWVIGIGFKCVTAVPAAHVDSETGTCFMGWFPNTTARRAFGVATAVGEFLLPLSIIAFCYVRMAKAIRKLHFSAGAGEATTAAANRPTATAGIESPSGMPAPVCGGSKQPTPRARHNILRVMTIVIVCFIISLGPKEFCLQVFSIGLVEIDLNGLLYNMLLFLNYSNCCLNPFIYLFKYDEFQKGVLVVILRRSPHAISPTAAVSNNSATLQSNRNRRTAVQEGPSGVQTATALTE